MKTAGLEGQPSSGILLWAVDQKQNKTQHHCGPVVTLQDMQLQGCGFESYRPNR